MRALTIAAAITLAACAGTAGADGQKVVISKEVAANFEGYKSWLTPMGFGFFAVTEDGRGAYGWGCPGQSVCRGPSSRSEAIKACENNSPGHSCFIFAENLTPVVDYSVAP